MPKLTAAERGAQIEEAQLSVSRRVPPGEGIARTGSRVMRGAETQGRLDEGYDHEQTGHA